MSEPMVNLTFERLLCARHGEPFRARWPKGYPIFVVKAFQAVASKSDVAAEVEAAAAGDIRHLEVLLDQMPACERLSRDEMHALYVEADIGVDGLCARCRRRTLGTPYSRSVADGVVTDAHLCFDCVLDGLRPLQ